MSQFGGKNAKKTSSDSKRHFTVVMGNKEHGLYVSSTPSSAAKKAVTKLCASNKGKKVEFHIREITQGSKKKTYGPYSGYIEKLKEPIELKGRVIKYKPVAKLSGKDSKKMRGGGEGNVKTCFHDRKNDGGTEFTILRINPTDFDYEKYEKINDKKIIEEIYPNRNNAEKDRLKQILVTFATGNWVRLGKGTEVEIIERVRLTPNPIDLQQNLQQNYIKKFGVVKKDEFGLVKINGVEGWVNMKYIINSEGKPCFE